MEPGTVAKYLQIAVAQQKRQLTKFTNDLGPNHLIVTTLRADLAELEQYIITLVKAQADAPKRK